MKKLFLAITCIAAVSCGEIKIEQAPESYYFSGKLMYFADAASIKDCLTGKTFPIVQNAEVEKAYTETISNPMDTLFTSFMGKVVAEKSEDTLRTIYKIAVDSVIKVTADAPCQNANTMTGIFQAELPKNEPKYRIILQLYPDYRAKKTVINLEKEESIELTGDWGRLEESMMIINSAHPEKPEANKSTKLKIDFEAMTLTYFDTMYKEEVTFSRVYVQ